MGYTPSQWISLNRKDKAFIIAAIKIKLEEEKTKNDKIKAKSNGVRRK